MNLSSLSLPSEDDTTPPSSTMNSALPLGSHLRRSSTGVKFFSRQISPSPSLPPTLLCECLAQSPVASELELLKACTIGRLDIVEQLVQANVSVESITNLADHVHAEDCSEYHSDVSERLRRKMSPGPGWTPLCAAAVRGHADIVEFLLDAGASPDGMTLEHETRTGVSYFPLYLACGKGHIEVVELLLAHKSRYDINMVQQQGYNVVIGACMVGNDDVRVLQTVVAAGANVNHLDPKGGSAMFLCAQHGRPEFMKVLLEVGASTNPRPGNCTRSGSRASGNPPGSRSSESRNSNGGSGSVKGRNSAPLHIAVSRGNLSCVQLLLDYGAEVDTRIISSGASSLVLASYAGDIGMMEVLLKHGAGVELPDVEGRTSLHKAAERDQVEAVALLVKHGADLKSHDIHGRTPICIAVAKGSLNTAKLLLSAVPKRAEGEPKDDFVPVIAAMDSFFSEEDPVYHDWAPDMFALILSFLPDVNQYSTVPLIHHVLCVAHAPLRHQWMLELLARGVDVEARNALGMTPLMQAASMTLEKEVEMLCGLADLDAIDNDGNTVSL